MKATTRILSTCVALGVALACQPKGDGATHSPGAGAAGTVPVIDAARMQATLEAFSADDMRGRFTLHTPDIDRAAAVLADAYRAAGIPGVTPDYRVTYDARAGSTTSQDVAVWLDVDGRPVEIPAEDGAAAANGGGTPVVGPVVAVGSGADAKANAKARNAIALAFLDGADPAMIGPKVDALRTAGAKGAVFVLPPSGTLPPPAALRDAVKDPAMPAVVLRVEALRTITIGGKPLPELDPTARAATHDLSNVQISLAARRVDEIRKAPNVLAWMQGTDLADEIVIVGAHFDHIGTTERGHYCSEGTRDDGTPDDVCNGADDNGSGTVGVLEIARAMAEAKVRPRRSIVFAHFSGEELGLFGSKALADHPPDAPPFTTGKVVAMINMDMIGRLGAAGLSIGGVGSSDAWIPILREVGDHDLEVMYERAITGRSDHASFYEHDVPVLFFFTGLHDDYHGPGDESSKINFEGLAEIAEMAMQVTLACADGRPLGFTPPRTPREGLSNALPGSDPSTLEKIDE